MQVEIPDHLRGVLVRAIVERRNKIVSNRQLIVMSGGSRDVLYRGLDIEQKDLETLIRLLEEAWK